jgi:hypothetical protein
MNSKAELEIFQTCSNPFHCMLGRPAGLTAQHPSPLPAKKQQTAKIARLLKAGDVKVTA